VDAGVDAAVCTTQLVLGPVNVPVFHSGLPGIGDACSASSEPHTFHVYVFAPGGALLPTPHGLLMERDVTCDATTDYLLLGEAPAFGELDVAIESVDANVAGAHLVAGADLIRPTCEEPGGEAIRGYECDPIRVTVTPCVVGIAPVALNCEDRSGRCF
jgi:hypothetical protein